MGGQHVPDTCQPKQPVVGRRQLNGLARAAVEGRAKPAIELRESPVNNVLAATNVTKTEYRSCVGHHQPGFAGEPFVAQVVRQVVKGQVAWVDGRSRGNGVVTAPKGP